MRSRGGPLDPRWRSRPSGRTSGRQKELRAPEPLELATMLQLTLSARSSPIRARRGAALDAARAGRPETAGGALGYSRSLEPRRAVRVDDTQGGLSPGLSSGGGVIAPVPPSSGWSFPGWSFWSLRSFRGGSALAIGASPRSHESRQTTQTEPRSSWPLVCTKYFARTRISFGLHELVLDKSPDTLGDCESTSSLRLLLVVVIHRRQLH